MSESEARKKSGRGKWIVIGVGIAIVAVIGIFATTSMATFTNTTSAPSIIPTQHKVNIVNGMITVNAGEYQVYRFSAPSGASDVRVSGSFTASGGSGNDIRIAILEEEAFINWKNGHQIDAYYTSGQMTVGRINTNVPAGDNLYLIYDNTFSVFSSKRVDTTVDLIYTQ